MGGSGGGIIVRNIAVGGLQNPVVHGQLPATTTGSLDPILVKHPTTWTEHECEIVGRAFMWAICNLK
jgi:hypothetical protein